MIGMDSERFGAAQVGVGMKVRSADDTPLGRITELLAEGFRVEKGLIFRHAHVVPFDAVASIDGDVVYLRQAIQWMQIPKGQTPWDSITEPGREGHTSVASANAPGRGRADDDAYSSTRAELSESHPSFPTGLIDTGDGRFARPDDSPEGLPERVRISEPEDTMVDIDGKDRFFRPSAETEELLVDTDGDGRYARPEDAGKVDGWRSPQRVGRVRTREGLVDTDGDGRYARPEDAGKVDGFRSRGNEELVDTDGDGRFARPEDAGKVDGFRSRKGLVDTDGDGRYARPEDAGLVDGFRSREGLVDTDGDGRFARPEDAGKVDGWRALDASAGAVTSLEGLRSEDGLVDTDGDGRFARPEDAGKVDGAKAHEEERRTFFARSDDDPPSRR